jgi:hypothetical protein
MLEVLRAAELEALATSCAKRRLVSRHRGTILCGELLCLLLRRRSEACLFIFVTSLLCRVRSPPPQVRLFLDTALLPIGPLRLERRRPVVEETRKLRSLLRSRQLVVGPMLEVLRAAELEALATSCAKRRLVP